MNYNDIYSKCIAIRLFEKRVESEFASGSFRGTTHGCIGQEIIPVLVMENVNKSLDYITGTHRCHGQVLAYNGDCYSLACEMMGKADGFVGGMGGSQHIKVDKYITNGITGGMLPTATGLAMGIRKSDSEGMVVSFVGDGGFNEGYVQESLNFAVKYALPLLVICENNKYAMSTRTLDYSAGIIKDRIQSFGMQYVESSSSFPDQLEEDIRQSFSYVRKNRKPCFIEIHTARLCGHSKSDSMEYMSDEEKENDINSDPIVWLKDRMELADIERIDKDILKKIDSDFKRAKNCKEYTLTEWRKYNELHNN